MKNILKLIFGLSFSLFLNVGCASGPDDPKEVLQGMLEHLDRHHSFTYDVRLSSWMPGETEQDASVYHRKTIEVEDDQERYVGARYVQTVDDRFFFGYDGKKRLRDTPDPIVFEVDSLFKGITEYRVVSTPFFQMARRIADYALTTEDSIRLEMTQTDQEYQVRLLIFTEDQVDFSMGSLSPYIKAVPEMGIFMAPPHVYVLHIDKRSLLPVRYYRLLGHQSSSEEVSHVVFDQMELEDFDLYGYLPEGFSFLQHEHTGNASGDKLKMGDLAPDFALTDTNGNVYRLSQFRGKRVLLEFTSIACGVCQIVPPFLNQLSEQFPDLQILSVEAWNMKPSSCRNWVQKKGIRHPYLLDGKDVLPMFSNDEAVPSFFVLDQEGRVVLSLTGYDEASTTEAILGCLKEMPQQ